jgi:hypothetical protein
MLNSCYFEITEYVLKYINKNVSAKINVSTINFTLNILTFVI